VELIDHKNLSGKTYQKVSYFIKYLKYLIEKNRFIEESIRSENLTRKNLSGNFLINQGFKT